MKDLDINFPLDKFEKLIIDLVGNPLMIGSIFGIIKETFFQLINIGTIK